MGRTIKAKHAPNYIDHHVPYLCTFVLFVEEFIYQLIALADQLFEFVAFQSNNELIFTLL